MEKQTSLDTPPWYVISGGPGSGKTTLIRMLEQRGFATVPEHARHFIDEELLKGRSLSEIHHDRIAFQRHVLLMQVEHERYQPRDKVTFLDRGIPDTLAYQRFYDIPEGSFLKDAVANCRYRKVFILDLLPLVTDYARSESIDAQRRIHQLLIEVYEALPFPVVQVPVMPPDQRLEFILAHL